MKRIVLFSGGVDSLTTVLMLDKQGLPYTGLYIDLGHRYAKQEGDVIFDLAWKLKMNLEILSLRDIGRFEKPTSEIPLRNLLLIVGGVLYDGDEIYLSIENGTSENESNDRDESFITLSQELLTRMSGKNIFIRNEVTNMTKEDEMRWTIDNVSNGKELLLSTFSCYNPHQFLLGMCGQCPACIRWFLAGIGVDLHRRDWRTSPLHSDVFEEYLIGTKSGKYAGRRGEQYIKVFEKLGVW